MKTHKGSNNYCFPSTHQACQEYQEFVPYENQFVKIKIFITVHFKFFRIVFLIPYSLFISNINIYDVSILSEENSYFQIKLIVTLFRFYPDSGRLKIIDLCSLYGKDLGMRELAKYK